VGFGLRVGFNTIGLNVGFGAGFHVRPAIMYAAPLFSPVVPFYHGFPGFSNWTGQSFMQDLSYQLHKYDPDFSHGHVLMNRAMPHRVPVQHQELPHIQQQQQADASEVRVGADGRWHGGIYGEPETQHRGVDLSSLDKARHHVDEHHHGGSHHHSGGHHHKAHHEHHAHKSEPHHKTTHKEQPHHTAEHKPAEHQVETRSHTGRRYPPTFTA